MKNIFLVGFFCACSFLCNAQEIKMYKTFGGVRYEMDTLVLSPKQVLEVLKDNPVSFEEFKRAKLNYNVAGVLGFVGGVLIGFPIGTAMVGGDPEWGLAAGGVGLLLASIPFNRAYKGRAFGAIELYNKKEARVNPVFYFNGTQARLVVRF
ncbi:MAG: hypothetical protein JNM78_01400 [Cyclobacteriaceae bacterium]|nr:hypothetical protein [Cyclobacteriaceae bacterium]